ncbi:MAG: hypothetical protein OHK0012_23250 [Synechococcales cyanobacterium]
MDETSADSRGYGQTKGTKSDEDFFVAYPKMPVNITLPMCFLKLEGLTAVDALREEAKGRSKPRAGRDFG